MNPETVRYCFTEKELLSLFGRQGRPVLFRLLISALCFIIMGIFAVISASEYHLSAYLFGIGTCLLAILLLMLLGSKRSNRQSATTMLRRTYQYKIDDTYFTLEQFQQEKLIRFYHVPYAEIDRIRDWRTHYAIVHGGISFLIRKEPLQENSALLDYARNHPEKFTTEKRMITESFLGFLAIWILFFAIFLLNFPGKLFAGAELWIALAALPAPLGLLTYGYVQKAKGGPAQRHIFNGWLLLASLILCTLNALL